MITYDLEKIKKNVTTLQEQLNKKDRINGFWIITSRKDFKPLKKVITEKNKITKKTVSKINDIKEHLLKDKGQYFADKKLAYIRFDINALLYKITQEEFNNNFNKIKNNFIIKLNIVIYQLNKKGQIGNTKWECIINFTLENLTTMKIKFKNAEIFMRQVADKLVITNDMAGTTYNGYKNVLENNIKKRNK